MSTPGFSRAVDVHLKSILVASDFSPVSAKALRHGVAIARHYGSKLYLLHVVSALGFNMVGPEAVAQATELAWRGARGIGSRLVPKGALDGLSHEIVITHGEVWKQVERVIKQEQIDMLVVGTHSRIGLSKIILGSVAEQIFRHASCPVLTIGPHCPTEAQAVPSGTMRPLLFPTNFSDKSLKAFRYAVSFANQRKTQIVLLHVLSSVPAVESNRWFGADDLVEIRQAARSNAMYRLRSLIAEVDLEIEPICIAEFGEPADVILNIAQELHVEGIIMGLKRTEHVNTVSHLPGSTTYQVVCRASCPVLTACCTRITR